METILIKNKFWRIVRVNKPHGIHLISKDGAELVLETKEASKKEEPKTEEKEEVKETPVKIKRI